MRFAYHRAGHGGVPIVLLHGWPQTSWAWRRVTPLLGPVCDVVVPDLPGFGYSSKPEGGFDKKTIARRLRDFVRALGLARIALVGHDLGGHVAYAYAVQWPQEVSQDRRGERDLRGLVKTVRRAGRPMRRPRP
jgi:pimeloyl-ACP methyl ester carboxylesterase